MVERQNHNLLVVGSTPTFATILSHCVAVVFVFLGNGACEL